MKKSMNAMTETGKKEKIANMIGGFAKGMAQASSDKCFFLIMHEPKMPKSLYKHD